jgi:hypothetical protein
MNDLQIVRSEKARSHIGSIAIQKLDGHTSAVLGEERDCLGAVSDLLLNRINRSSLLNEVCLTEFVVLIVAKILDSCDHLNEFVVVELVCFVLLLNLIIVVVDAHLLNLFFIHLTVHSIHHAAHEVVASCSIST